MGYTATFDYALWTARYPEFALVPLAQASAYFLEAGMYWRNDGTSEASTLAIQTTLMNMLTAHIAALNAVIEGQPATTLVGRISQAGEGSVSVSTEFEGATPDMGWFLQTKYGAAFWQATKVYRSMRYRAPCSYPSRRFPFV